MKKIKHVKVGAYRIPITYRIISDAVGEFSSHPTPTISVHSDASGLSMASSIYHEALHALMWMTGMEDMDVKEERMVRWIETHTVALLRDNPALAAGLLE